MPWQSRPPGRADSDARARIADRADLGLALAGDKDAFARLIVRREANLYGLALALTGHREDAGDALQNAVILAYRRLKTLRQAGSFDSWLRRIVAREAMAIARRRAVGGVYATPVSLPLDEIDHQGSLGTWDVDLGKSAAARLDLAAALEALDDWQRMAVILRYVADLPVREIARLTGVPGGTVKSRIHYGLKRLRQVMAPGDGRRGGGGSEY